MVRNIFTRYATTVISAVIEKLRRKKLSAQINITYGVILFLTLIFVNIGTTAGVYFLFFHQAERAIETSIEKVAERGPFEKWQAEVYVDDKLCVSALLSAMKTGKKSI